MSFLVISLVALAAGAVANPLSTYPNGARGRSPIAYAPMAAVEHPHGTVNDSYIVMLKKDVAPVLMQNHLNFVQTVHSADSLYEFDGLSHIYDGHVKGYAGKFSAETLHQIRQMPEVDYVEADQIVRTMDIEPEVGSQFEQTKTQRSAPWGLARISHRQKLTFGTFSKYEYAENGGEGVDVYVIDTGVYTDHVEFEGRAHWGKTLVKGDSDDDANGHGTHCAGTIASREYGVAKKAHVYAVKVLGSNGSGSMSDVVAGVVWAATEAKAKAVAAVKEFARTGKTSHKGSVANMSLGGGKSQALDDTVNAAVEAGMHFAVAAGNDNTDACRNSPAAAELAVTVGASTLGDERAYFSNHGCCVDVFAPGLNIKSSYIGSEIATATLSGTSMAAPHTAGILAYLLSIYPSKDFNPNLVPDFIPPVLSAPIASGPSLLRMYAFAHGALPSWASVFLPPPGLVEQVVAVAPIPPPMITPKQLKAALLALASEDVLRTLPTCTPNLLIFNNATA